MSSRLDYEPQAFIGKLLAEGARVDECVDLEERLMVSSNWKSSFLRLAQGGARTGIRIRPGRMQAQAALRIMASHGFDTDACRQGLRCMGFHCREGSEPGFSPGLGRLGH